MGGQGGGGRQEGGGGGGGGGERGGRGGSEGEGEGKSEEAAGLPEGREERFDRSTGARGEWHQHAVARRRRMRAGEAAAGAVLQ